MIRRIEYKRGETFLEKNDALIIKYGKRERIIKAHKWYLNRNTPVGVENLFRGRV